MKVIVYTNNVEIYEKYLSKRTDEKLKESTALLKKVKSKNDNFAIFEDGEYWHMKKPNDSSRGYRWDKCLVDIQAVSITVLELITIHAGPGVDRTKNLIYINW